MIPRYWSGYSAKSYSKRNNMERQIKFRGKQINGEWAYGDLLRIGGGCIIYIGSKTETQTPDIPKESNVAVELFDDDIAIVIPDTLGQFTGLTDCNGKEIYEGDIFTVNGKYPKLVEYREDRVAFCIANVDELDKKWIYPWQQPALDWWYDFNREIVVIGNKFDNPDLIPNQPTEV